jgi:hypothetical protein
MRIIKKIFSNRTIVFEYDGIRYEYDYYADKMRGIISIKNQANGKIIYSSGSPELTTELGTEIESELRKTFKT